MSQRNLRVVLNSRPGVNGEPIEENFRTEECAYPHEDLLENHVLVKTLCLSVDPALRCRMNPNSGVHYMSSWQVGEMADGLAGVGIVMESCSARFEKGDFVTSTFLWPWMAYFTYPDSKLLTISNALIKSKPSLSLGVLGITGLTAYVGITQKGHVTKGSNQTMVVSAAAGSTGSLAGQIGKLEGCAKVVGICGTNEKCTILTEELGFDAAINYKTDDVSKRLQEVCPTGVDVYFDNVGGDVSNAVIKQMTESSHVILCGQISVYNKDVPYPPPLPQEVETIMKERHITRDRFLVLDYSEKFESALQILGTYLQEGKLKVKETISEGIENTGKAFVSMMKGGNIGKQVVHVADP
ncbi:prostaglandin reductase 2-like [Gigantopelta aegis]|uniref:prostaglandin reductase 2-like n=1 Tax=Gigantopelta aegis TaxID=1735272 RepID=UPI001B887AF8|nr:prostaglandin reductase 2-like [Gigantopelta aegis]